MCYIEFKNDKYETSEDLKHLLQYILRLDKTAEDSQRANTILVALGLLQFAEVMVLLVVWRVGLLFMLRAKKNFRMRS